MFGIKLLASVIKLKDSSKDLRDCKMKIFLSMLRNYHYA